MNNDRWPDIAPPNPHQPGTEKYLKVERIRAENNATWQSYVDGDATDNKPLAPSDDERDLTPEEREAYRAARLRQRIAQRADEEYINLQAREAAKRRLAAELDPVIVPPPISLTELLAMPDEPTSWRIDGLWPLHGTIVLAAQYKAGKTTTVQNLIRSLVDGDRFLGIYPVEQVTDGCVMLTDFEMHQSKLKEWLRDQGIRNTDRVKLWALRGSGSAFDLLDETIRQQWVKYLAEARTEVWIVDCLGPILSALAFDESANKEVGRVLDALITTATAAGVGEILLVHHMGHGAERSRGASRLRDWPDAEWRLVRQRDSDNPYAEPEPNAPRFFSAFGRDVDVREGQLVFNAAARRLVYAEGNRQQSKVNVAMKYVLTFIRDFPGRSGRAIEDAAKAAGENRTDIREARTAAISKGYVSTSTGEKRAELHALTPAGFAYLGQLTASPEPEDDPWSPEVFCPCGGYIPPDEAVSGIGRCSNCRELA